MAGSGVPTPQQAADMTKKAVMDAISAGTYSCKKTALTAATQACEGSSGIGRSNCMNFNYEKYLLINCWSMFKTKIDSHAKAICTGAAGPCVEGVAQSIADYVDPRGFAHKLASSGTVQAPEKSVVNTSANVSMHDDSSYTPYSYNEIQVGPSAPLASKKLMGAPLWVWGAGAAALAVFALKGKR